MFCSKCGSQNADDIKFCANCGAPMMEAPSHVDAQNSAVNASNQQANNQPNTSAQNGQQGGAMPFMSGNNAQTVNNQQPFNGLPNGQQFNGQPNGQQFANRQYGNPNMNQQPGFGGNQYGPNAGQQFGQPQQAPKKKNAALPIIIIGAVILVLVCGIGAFAMSKSKKNKSNDDSASVVASVEATVEATEEATVEATEEATEEASEAATEATTEEVEETTTKKSSSASYDGELSDDVYSFQAIINGEFYQFPMYATELEERGWTLTGSHSSDTLNANSYTYYEYTHTESRAKLTFYISNYADSTVSLDDCIISGFDYDSYYDKQKLVQIILPGNVDAISVTPEDIEAAYGLPSETYESDSADSKSYTYSTDYNHSLKIRWYDGEVETVTYKCLGDTPEGYDSDSLGVKGETPSYITDYVAPKSLSSDFFDYTVEIMGDLYYMYCPVQEFLDNGWKITDNKSTDIAAHSMEAFTFSKNNQSLRIYVYNEDDYIQSIENCLVEEVTVSASDPSNPSISVKVSNGVTFGMTVEEVEKALTDAGVNYELKEESTYSYIDVDGPDGYSDGYYFSFRDGKLKTIEVEHDY